MRVVASVICIIVGLTSSLDSIAQRKSAFKIRTRSPEWYLGPEVVKVTHAFTLSSDLPELGDQRITQTGLMLGGMAGHRIARLRIRKGLLETNSSAPERIRTTIGGGAITFFPLQIVSRRLRAIEPYATLGVSRARYDFFGNYVSLTPPASTPPLPNPDCVCPCCPGHSLPADPDAVAREPIAEPFEESEALPEGTLLGDITTRNLNAGFGIETHIQMKGVFLHVFAEGNYLVSSRISENNVAFTKTSVNAPLEFRVGIAAGISR